LPISLTAAIAANQADESVGTQANAAQAQVVPLSSVARVGISEGANQIKRENGKRRIIVTANGSRNPNVSASTRKASPIQKSPAE